MMDIHELNETIQMQMNASLSNFRKMTHFSPELVEPQ